MFNRSPTASIASSLKQPWRQKCVPWLSHQLIGSMTWLQTLPIGSCLPRLDNRQINILLLAWLCCIHQRSTNIWRVFRSKHIDDTTCITVEITFTDRLILSQIAQQNQCLVERHIATNVWGVTTFLILLSQRIHEFLIGTLSRSSWSKKAERHHQKEEFHGIPFQTMILISILYDSPPGNLHFNWQQQSLWEMIDTFNDIMVTKLGYPSTRSSCFQVILIVSFTSRRTRIPSIKETTSYSCWEEWLVQ